MPTGLPGFAQTHSSGDQQLSEASCQPMLVVWAQGEDLGVCVGVGGGGYLLC